MTFYNDSKDVRKLESNLSRLNAYHPTTKEPVTCEDNYHINAFNQAYLKYLGGVSIKNCVTDLAHVLLECNTHLDRNYGFSEPRDVVINRAFELCFPEFKAFVDFREALPDGEDFEMYFE
jgi:hypothetical protein